MRQRVYAVAEWPGLLGKRALLPGTAEAGFSTEDVPGDPEGNTPLTSALPCLCRENEGENEKAQCL